MTVKVERPGDRKREKEITQEDTLVTSWSKGQNMKPAACGAGLGAGSNARTRQVVPVGR